MVARSVSVIVGDALAPGRDVDFAGAVEESAEAGGRNKPLKAPQAWLEGVKVGLFRLGRLAQSAPDWTPVATDDTLVGSRQDFTGALGRRARGQRGRKAIATWLS
jgi:hypothetical protein